MPQEGQQPVDGTPILAGQSMLRRFIVQFTAWGIVASIVIATYLIASWSLLAVFVFIITILLVMIILSHF